QVASCRYLRETQTGPLTNSTLIAGAEERSFPRFSYAAGRNKLDTVACRPACVLLLTRSEPRCFCTMSLTSDNPIPLPVAFVLKNAQMDLGRPSFSSFSHRHPARPVSSSSPRFQRVQRWPHIERFHGL